MPITERTLRKWRKEALKSKTEDNESMYKGIAPALASGYTECQERILRLTAELLDQHLLRKK